MLYILTVYSLFFDQIPTKITGVSKKINVSNGHFFISNSCFLDLFENTNGGAISCFIDSKLVVFSCSFHNCSAIKAGGAICFKTSNGEVVIYNTKSSKCYDFSPDNSNSFESGQFAYLKTGTSGKNEVQLTSITQCFYPSSVQYAAILLHQGVQKVSSFNSTRNVLTFYSGIRIVNANNGRASFCSFCDNHATNYICIKTYSGSISYESINIINNTQVFESLGIVRHFSGTTTFQGAIFMQNSKKYLFATNAGTLRITSCWILQEYLDLGGKTTFSNIITSPTSTIEISPIEDFDCMFATKPIMPLFHSNFLLVYTVCIILY